MQEELAAIKDRLTNDTSTDELKLLRQLFERLVNALIASTVA